MTTGGSDQPQQSYLPPSAQAPVPPPPQPNPQPGHAPAPQVSHGQPPQYAPPTQPPAPPRQGFAAPQQAAYAPPQQPQYTPAPFGRPVYASALAQPALYAPPAAPAAPAPAPAIPALPMPVRKGRTVSIWLFGVLGFLLLALAGYFVWALGSVASIIGLVLALIPLAIVFFGVRLIDRWEPEPKRIVIFAIAWGAIAAVGLTLLFDVMFGVDDVDAAAVIQAPIVEELFKGLGVFLIYLMARRTFDGPVDGIVYGALVGAGFAFTENIQYFAISLLEGGGEQLTMTFVLRGLMSPFAHAMFTALTGFAIGLAARRGASVAGVLGAGALGMLGAMLLHGFWNGSATFADFFVLYVTLQVPLFVGFILGIVALKREEARLTRERLSEYAVAGWFTPQEVDMLATRAGRKVGLAWAATLRGDRRPIMRGFIKDATALAAVRQRAISGRDRYAAEDERALLMRTRAARAALLAY
ncbi:PrsW family intramembrane metalloprotease [Microbacterium sp. M28]|uniref:PrsW family intramembrane metalloprotease n=1 Tax=Microbacterium sp. M28 TaxID=2962064 RepID=UPI0021F3FE62|nr:PrsW family intramembrane metalloprotease [Microbacterium sp. M28]UYO98337.1 PrsW family intramembrane metalloprotease [Microbacterium sp. M28]